MLFSDNCTQSFKRIGRNMVCMSDEIEWTETSMLPRQWRYSKPTTTSAA